MSKRNKIIYWVATLWLSLGMLSTGFVQLTKMEDEVVRMKALGYSDYILTLLGICKALGVIAILVPRFPLLKEWAYAGFFFLMAGALFSHASNGDAAKDFFGPSLLLALTMISWYFRPAERKIGFANG
jgi:hypothetical protein